MKHDDIFVSVIMPTFNTSESFLRESIESILKQTHKNFEFIITVDGSSNGDLDIVKDYAKTDSRILLINNGSNKGLVFSLNNMIERAIGKYIFRMDSDDISKRNRLHQTICFFESHPSIDIVGTQVQRIINGKKRIKKSKMPISDHSIKTNLLWNSPFYHPTIAFRACSIKTKHILYSKGYNAEDFKMWLTCCEHELTFNNLKRSMLYYRVHETQTTKTKRDMIATNALQIINEYHNYLGIQMEKDVFVATNMFLLGHVVENRCDFEKIQKGICIMYNHFANDKQAVSLFKRKLFHECVRQIAFYSIPVCKIFKKNGYYKVFRINSLGMLLLQICSLVSKYGFF